MKEYIELHNALEGAARIFSGVGVAFAGAGHYGLSMMAICEGKERLYLAGKIIDKLIERKTDFVLQALPAPPCDYKDPVAAMSAMISADDIVLAACDKLYTAIMQANEPPMFISWIKEKFLDEKEEVRGIGAKVMQYSGSADDMKGFNKEMAEKYSWCEKD